MSQLTTARILRFRIFGKSPAAAFLRMNARLWKRLPLSFVRLQPVRLYGDLLHALNRAFSDRAQYPATFFLRNRPELELIRRLVDQLPNAATTKIALFGCSIGAELYSVVWVVRSARPDLNIVATAVDISAESLKIAQAGVYALDVSGSPYGPLFARVTETEMREMFEKNGHSVKIKALAQQGIVWRLGDARDPHLIDLLGPQDIVIANRFLCHMDPPDAEDTLRNLARSVGPDGYLFVSGVDVDVRTRVAQDLKWQPVAELMEEIHDGDPSLREGWPCSYWGLEPLDKRRSDWQVRYASVFRLVTSK